MQVLHQAQRKGREQISEHLTFLPEDSLELCPVELVLPPEAVPYEDVVASPEVDAGRPEGDEEDVDSGDFETAQNLNRFGLQAQSIYIA